MDRFGSDKPDIRFGMELVNVTETVKDSEFVVFKNAIEAGGTVRGINAKGQGGMARRRSTSWLILQKVMEQRDLLILQSMKTELSNLLLKFMTEEENSSAD